MKEAPSHYEVLGIDRRANAAEIKAARGRRIAQWHPDKYLNRTSLERQNAEYQFKRVLEAYDVLGDPHLRERYDRECEKNSSRPQSARGKFASTRVAWDGGLVRALDPNWYALEGDCRRKIGR
jgi:DnaJ-class molecular chaperone